MTIVVGKGLVKHAFSYIAGGNGIHNEEREIAIYAKIFNTHEF